MNLNLLYPNKNWNIKTSYSKRNWKNKNWPKKRLEENNFRLQKSFNEKITMENNLYIKVNLLRDQVKELNEFHFQVKLRQLIKKNNRISI